MSQRDGTGPQGKGPRTGRAMGNCDQKDHDSPKKNPQPSRDRRGAGQGRGQGGRMGSNS